MTFSKSFLQRATILSAMVAILVFASHSVGEEPTAAKEKVFIGYLAGTPQHITYARYTHLCHAFVTAEPDGKLIPREGVPSRQLTSDAHASGVRVLLSLGGWGWDANFALMVLDPKAEDRYVEAVMKMIDDYDYDGIDLDWEYPDSREEIPGFERLTRRFRSRLDTLGKAKGRHMELTMATASHPDTLDWLEKDFLLETMDWINVMTYDYSSAGWSTFSGHNAPLFASPKVAKKNQRSIKKTIDYLLSERKIPADRIALGIPLYGRVFSVPPYESNKNASAPSRPSVNYNEIVRLQEEEHWTSVWDNDTKTPWLHSPKKDEFIGYDDIRSVTLKTNWAKELGLRGVFFWQVEGDYLPGLGNPLQDAVHQAWNSTAVSPAPEN